MSADVKDERVAKGEAAPPAENAAPPRPPLIQRLRVGLREVQWPLTLLIALATAVLWCALFISRAELQLLAGLVPVTAGLILGRRVKSQWMLHGLVLGVASFLIALGLVAAYAALASAGLAPLTEQARLLIAQWPNTSGLPSMLILIFISTSVFALLPFPAFGTVMAGRSEERNRAIREMQTQRGGRLDRPGTVRNAEDLMGLSLPQLGYYVNTLFKKQGFTFKDYRFLDKDRNLDLWMEYQGETWWLRLTVADKVRPGVVESLMQDMRRDQITKGVVITSTEFTPDALKATRGRKNVVLIDGPTLVQMAQ
ncbi:MAG: restriction endonuclease [Chloroflexales bacterium]|nr:restriction endonuclease [Chloroflexales bacterium]